MTRPDIERIKTDEHLAEEAFNVWLRRQEAATQMSNELSPMIVPFLAGWRAAFAATEEVTG